MLKAPRDEITDAMTFMSDHTPLEVTGAEREQRRPALRSQLGLAERRRVHVRVLGREPCDRNQKIRSTRTPAEPGTVAHEFGHALGFPHEFQRDDRDSYVDVCFNTDPFNYSKMGSAFWPDPHENLSPYDFASVMNDGYSGCVIALPGPDPAGPRLRGRRQPPQRARHQQHLPRVRQGAGRQRPGDRFGVAVSSGDYDDDGYKDVVVANVQERRPLAVVLPRGGNGVVEGLVGGHNGRPGSR